MGYVYDFDIGSILFFGLTIFFYLYQKRLRNLPDGIYTAMLICSMIAVVFDLAAAVMEYQALRYPVWLLYAVNMLFIFGMQTCLPLFFLYAVATAGRFNRFSRWKRIAFAIPYAVTMTLLFLSPFVNFGVLWIDGMHIYRHGVTHGALYMNTGFYVLAGVVVLFKNSGRIQRVKRNVILLFMALLFLSVVLQLVFPRYLLTASATALALTSVFYVLQSPIDQVDPLTGAFSRTLLPSLLTDYGERGRSYTLLLVALRSFDEFMRSYGFDAGDTLLASYAGALMARYPEGVVAYMDTSEFMVVLGDTYAPDQAERLLERIPKTVAVGDLGRVTIDVRLGIIPYEAGESSAANLSVADYMLREMLSGEDGAVQFADMPYKRTCAMALGLEAQLGALLCGDGTEIVRTSIWTADGSVALEAARLGVPGDMAGSITPARFLRAVGQGGHGEAYYRRLLSALSEQRGAYNAQRRLCIPLLPAFFLQEDAPERMRRLAGAEGFIPEQLLLAVNESEIASSAAQLTENIERLAQMGFQFLLDSFAEGYTDMSLMISLPFRYARLHESFVRDAACRVKDARLLSGLIGVLTDVGVAAVCPGIRTALERQAAVSASAPLMEGPGACQCVSTAAQV